MAVDDDDLLNSMCPKCHDEAKDHDKCSRCGKSLSIQNQPFINPNFDVNRFNKLATEEGIDPISTNETEDGDL